jgi:hypothetical protein
MSTAIVAANVRPASIEWRWGTIFQAIVPSSAMHTFADVASEGGRLEQSLLIVSFESPVATRMLAFLESAPSDVLHSVEGILPISYLGRLNEAIVATIVRAPVRVSALNAATVFAAHVSKPYIRRSIQRLLSVDHVARSVHEMLSHPLIAQMCECYRNLSKYQGVDNEDSKPEYSGPRIRCMTWPPEAQKSLIRDLEAAGAPLGASVGSFTHLLCVVYVRDTVAATSPAGNLIFFGLLPLDHLPLGPAPDEFSFNHAPSSASSGIAVFNGNESGSLPSHSLPDPQGTTGSHSRAQYKLHEAIEALRDRTPADFLSASGGTLGALHTSSSSARVTTNWRAIDVGAAPGGWTAFLAGPDVGCSKVMAVDAASLSPAVLVMPSVCHVKSSLQEALVSGALDVNAPYDLLVADLNADPRDCARWLSPLFPLMKPGSALVLTMKLPYATVDSELTQGQPIIEAAAEMLSFGWTAFHCRWLMANTVNERTLFAFRRAVPVGPPPLQDSGREAFFNSRRSHHFRKALALQRQAAALPNCAPPEVPISSAEP